LKLQDILFDEVVVRKKLEKLRSDKQNIWCGRIITPDWTERRNLPSRDSDHEVILRHV